MSNCVENVFITDWEFPHPWWGKFWASLLFALIRLEYVKYFYDVDLNVPSLQEFQNLIIDIQLNCSDIIYWYEVKEILVCSRKIWFYLWAFSIVFSSFHVPGTAEFKNIRIWQKYLPALVPVFLSLLKRDTVQVNQNEQTPLPSKFNSKLLALWLV